MVGMDNRMGDRRGSRAASGTLLWVVAMYFVCGCAPLLWRQDMLDSGEPGSFFLASAFMMVVVVLVGWLFEAYAALRTPPTETMAHQVMAVLFLQGWAIISSTMLALALWGKPFTQIHLMYWFLIFSVFFAVTLFWFLEVKHQAATRDRTATDTQLRGDYMSSTICDWEKAHPAVLVRLPERLIKVTEAGRQRHGHSTDSEVVAHQ